MNAPHVVHDTAIAHRPSAPIQAAAEIHREVRFRGGLEGRGMVVPRLPAGSRVPPALLPLTLVSHVPPGARCMNPELFLSQGTAPCRPLLPEARCSQ